MTTALNITTPGGLQSAIGIVRSATGGVGLLHDMTLEGDTVKRYEMGPEAGQEAMKYAQDNASGTYNLFFRNCRQFANEVVNTGKKTEKNAKKDKP